ncbi:MAG: hypothetical protein ABI652_00715 [Acidobacteriota bacterium]
MVTGRTVGYVLFVVAILAIVPADMFGQGRGRGGGQGGPAGGRGQQGPTVVIGQVKFVKGANIHATPSTAAIVLATVSPGLVLDIYEHRGVWYAVALTPDLRQKATPIRWYRNETRGFVHDSTVELVAPAK